MFQGQKILYLEDEILIALDTSEHLEQMGFDDVVVAHRLDQAVTASENIDFDFALLDINVDRGQTSLELGDTLKRNGVAVVYASGRSDRAEELRAKGFPFLDKPLALGWLTQTLKDVNRESGQGGRSKTAAKPQEARA